MSKELYIPVNNFIYEDYISDLTICDELVKWFHSNKKLHHPGKVGLHGKWIIDSKVKHSTDFGFNWHKERVEREVIDSYSTELQIILNRYLSAYGFANNVESFMISEPVQIQYYKPNEGYKELHFERDGNKLTISRHLVFQTYLNAVEDGGETEFYYQDYKCRAVKGKTLIWPADWTHTHRGIVSPTEDKYIITGWYSFA